MKAYPPLDHSDYSVVDLECNCSICTEWRHRFEQAQVAIAQTYGHERDCYCADCCEMRKLHGSYHASNNRRDLYCEIAFHAIDHPNSDDMMTWIEKVICDSRKYTEAWWYSESPKVRIDVWLGAYERASRLAKITSHLATISGAISQAIISHGLAVSGLAAA